jgi:hypothetical protein
MLSAVSGAARRTKCPGPPRGHRDPLCYEPNQRERARCLSEVTTRNVVHAIHVLDRDSADGVVRPGSRREP